MGRELGKDGNPTHAAGSEGEGLPHPRSRLEGPEWTEAQVWAGVLGAGLPEQGGWQVGPAAGRCKLSAEAEGCV